MECFTFTGRARRAIQAAGDEAAALGHEYIGPEHILLALLHDRESAAVGILAGLGSDLDTIRAEIEAVVKKGTSSAPAGASRPFTSRVKSSLELAMACAHECSNSSVGTQHLLVGLMREGKGIAAQVLVHSGMTIDQVVGALGRAADDDDVTRKGH